MTKASDITDEYISTLIKRYNNPSPNWRDVDADYVYYGPWEKQFGQPNLSQNKNLKIIYENPTVQIYKILR